MHISSWLSWQIDYLLFLQNFRDISGHIFDKFFLYITMFGEITIPFWVICLFYWVLNKKVGQFILLSYILGFIANTIAKTTACIYRPWILDCRVHPLPDAIPMATGYSFPSGHTAGAMSVWGGLAYSYWNNKILRYFCIFIVLAVMISRNYLGVHTPQDVVVSFFLALLMLYVSKKVIDFSDKNNKNCLIVVGGIFLATILTVLYVNIKPYPIHYLFGKILYDPTPVKTEVIVRSGFIFGTFIGWLLEKNYINFIPENGTVLRKILRYILGVGLLIGITALPIPVFTPIVEGFVKFFILGMFITCLYPFIIKKCKI